jgi:hypothetical protein
MANTAQYRVAFRFRQFDRKWNEVYGSNKGTVADALTAARACVASALLFRHPTVYISHIRITNPFSRRDSTLAQVTVTPPPTPAQNPESTEVAAVYTLVSSVAGVRRDVWLRGLPEPSVTRNPITGQDIPNNGLDAAVQSYVNTLATQGFGITALYPVDNAQNQRVPITSITVNADQTIALNCQFPPPVADLGRWVLYRFSQTQWPTLKGKWPGMTVGNTIIPAGYMSIRPPGTYITPGAAVRQESYRFGPLAQNAAVFGAFDSRDTNGGPLDTRGRSRAATRRFR